VRIRSLRGPGIGQLVGGFVVNIPSVPAHPLEANVAEPGHLAIDLFPKIRVHAASIQAAKSPDHEFAIASDDYRANSFRDRT
jgi:hypothetical protein